MRTSLVALFLLISSMAAAAAPGTPDTALARQVFDRVVAVTPPPKNVKWPPILEFETTDVINAYARPEYTEGQQWQQASLLLTTGLLEKVIEGDVDRLAFIIGHELAHHSLGHTQELLKRKSKTFKTMVYSRQDEFDADLHGTQFAVAAGFSYKRGIRALQRCIELGMEYSSFEGFSEDHPSWKDRLIQLDKDQAQIWNAMAAFDNGNYFLMVEQYLAAERCFRFVTTEFPSCTEAWANLGYALLMQYCDQLKEEDIRSYGIGHLVTGGFYKRAYSLEYQMRGEADNEVWWQAVGALREALRLSPSSTLAKANLGIAYLVRPEGKDIGQASRFLLEAAEEATRDETMDTQSRMAILVNAGVVEMSENNYEKTAEHFNAIDRLGKSLAGPARKQFASSAIARALDYNRGQLLSASKDRGDQKSALEMFDRYLKNMPPSTAWWPLAYEKYEGLCRGLGKTPTTKTDLTDRWKWHARFKPVVGVDENGASLVQLAQSQPELDSTLGAMTVIPVAGRAPIQRQICEARNLELLMASGRVVMITLRAPSAHVTLQQPGSGSEGAQLAVGMTRAQVEAAFDGLESESKPRKLIDKTKRYDIYRGVGLALYFEDDVLKEIVIANLQLH